MTIAPAYVTQVGDNHIVRLPEVPIGATVAVIVMPDAVEQTETARRARFAATLDAVRKASLREPPNISDAELDTLIERARKSSWS